MHRKLVRRGGEEGKVQGCFGKVRNIEMIVSYSIDIILFSSSVVLVTCVFRFCVGVVLLRQMCQNNRAGANVIRTIGEESAEPIMKTQTGG